MKMPLLILFIILLYCGCPLSTATENQDQKSDLINLLPLPEEVSGWFPQGEAQYAAGKDLFLLIDGGAAIYQEYGFEEAVHHTYTNRDGKSINLEIYKMDSPESAYGIYTFKKSAEGTAVNLGQAGWFESYYLIFWKGNFLITVIALDTDSTTLEAIRLIARVVDSKLMPASLNLKILSCLPAENLQSPGLIYLKGNLALFNQYIFDSRDIFNLQEGVLGRYSGYSLFLFQYRDQVEAKKWYDFAKSNLGNSARYTHFSVRENQFEIVDQQNKKICTRYYRQWILIAVGNPDLKYDHILNELEGNLLP